MSEWEQTSGEGEVRHEGSCLCGRIRFAAKVRLSDGTTRCNCRWCTKHGWWGVLVKPEAFEVLGDEAEVAPHADQRVRCPDCGVMVYGRADIPELGGPIVSINVRTFDDAPLEGSSVVYLDGRNNTWEVLGRGVYRSFGAECGP